MSTNQKMRRSPQTLDDRGFVERKIEEAQGAAETLVSRAKHIVVRERGDTGGAPDDVTLWKRICTSLSSVKERNIVRMLEKEDRLPNKALLALYTYVTLLPHMLLLLLNLIGDEETPRAAKVMGLGAAIYVINPFDLAPDIIPLIGAADDAGVIAIVLLSIVGMISETPDEVLRRHWRGRDVTIQTIAGVTDALRHLFVFNPRSEAVQRLGRTMETAASIERAGETFQGDIDMLSVTDNIGGQ